MNCVERLKKEVLSGRDITKEEALELANTEHLLALLEAANEIRESFCGNEFNLCSIINVKSGRCSENCKFCAQSAHYKTGCDIYPLLRVDEVLEAAKKCDRNLVDRFSLVSSTKELRKRDIAEIKELYSTLSSQTTLHLCASFGLADEESLKELKKAGVKTYHHNLETSKGYFTNICTTHTFKERVSTIKAAKNAGLDVCSGGIFGLGESMSDRVDLAFTLKELEVSSVPINILSPIKGTPLQDREILKEDEILRTIAVFRFILPKVYLRLAGGRKALKQKLPLALNGGINSSITGDFLTTTGQSVKDDKMMIKKYGFRTKRDV